MDTSMSLVQVQAALVANASYTMCIAMSYQSTSIFAAKIFALLHGL